MSDGIGDWAAGSGESNGKSSCTCTIAPVGLESVTDTTIGSAASVTAAGSDSKSLIAQDTVLRRVTFTKLDASMILNSPLEQKRLPACSCRRLEGRTLTPPQNRYNLRSLVKLPKKAVIKAVPFTILGVAATMAVRVRWLGFGRGCWE
jgi:hypothetical protein